MYLGIDCGTQGTKAVVFDSNGRWLGRGYAPHAIVERESGAREQEPAWWVDALKAACLQALRKVDGSEVIAAGVSGQQHGLVVLDEKFAVIRAVKLWNDTETAAQNQEVVDRMGGHAAYFAKTGMIPLTGYTVSKLLWLREREPENFLRIRHVLLPHEYLNFWLTGELMAEPGDASGTGYFNVRTRTWSTAVLDAVDGGSGLLRRALPELRSSDSIVGTVRPEVAGLLGLSSACKVSAGGGDNMMGAIGTGNVREGVITMSLGTSSTVYSFRETAVLDETGNVAPFCSSSGGWLPLVCTMNATNVVTNTLTMLGRTVTDIEAALDATQPGAAGLVMLPFLNGERTPDLPNARGSLVGLSATNFCAENLIRAAIEGVSFGILAGLDRIVGGAAAERILLIGGGARSRAWRQLIADASGLPVEVPVEEEAGCLGAALQALHAAQDSGGEDLKTLAGRWIRTDDGARAVPDASRRDAYDAARARYLKELQRLYAV